MVDLRAGWRPLAGLTVGGAVRNLLDRYYYEHLNRGYRNLPETGRICEPGRNVTFFLKYDF